MIPIFAGLSMAWSLFSIGSTIQTKKFIMIGVVDVDELHDSTLRILFKLFFFFVAWDSIAARFSSDGQSAAYSSVLF
jgi:exosortase/archaeosortase